MIDIFLKILVTMLIYEALMEGNRADQFMVSTGMSVCSYFWMPLIGFVSLRLIGELVRISSSHARNTNDVFKWIDEHASSAFTSLKEIVVFGIMVPIMVGSSYVAKKFLITDANKYIDAICWHINFFAIGVCVYSSVFLIINIINIMMIDEDVM